MRIMFAISGVALFTEFWLLAYYLILRRANKNLREDFIHELSEAEADLKRFQQRRK